MCQHCSLLSVGQTSIVVAKVHALCSPKLIATLYPLLLAVKVFFTAFVQLSWFSIFRQFSPTVKKLTSKFLLSSFGSLVWMISLSSQPSSAKLFFVVEISIFSSTVLAILSGLSITLTACFFSSKCAFLSSKEFLISSNGLIRLQSSEKELSEAETEIESFAGFLTTSFNQHPNPLSQGEFASLIS